MVAVASVFSLAESLTVMRHDGRVDQIDGQIAFRDAQGFFDGIDAHALHAFFGDGQPSGTDYGMTNSIRVTVSPLTIANRLTAELKAMGGGFASSLRPHMMLPS